MRSLGLVENVKDIEETIIKTQNGTALRVRDIATVSQGPKIRLGQIGKAIHRSDGVVVDDPDVVEGIVFLRKGADTATTLEGIHAMVRRLNTQILPPGVRISVWDAQKGEPPVDALEGADVVVHLAGEPVAYVPHRRAGVAARRRN